MENNYKLPDQNAARMRRSRNREAEQSEYSMPETLRQCGKGRTYAIRTYGCQANVRDSETIAGLLEQMSFTRAENDTEADVLVFNTCAVRKNAEEHVLGEIGNLKPLKLQHPDRIFALCGCMAQEEGIVDLLLKKYPQVDIIFGTHNLDRFPEMLAQHMQEGRRQVQVDSIEGNIIEGMPATRSRRFKAFVNIMYGCDKFCTYCIVPYTRGRERSRHLQNIVDEISEFKASGGKEVALLGQNVNAYGKDLQMADGFSTLLDKCADTGIDRIRFYTSHPRDYTSAAIDVMAARPNIMKALHLPVQSGSDEILRRMNRGYTRAHYLSLYDDMRSRIPDITFSTDIIVGFPGETDAQFEETLSLVDHCQFDQAFTFIYSPREGTPAAAMKDDIPEEVKKERLEILNEKVAGYARMKNEQYVGKTVSVLCDGPSKKNEKIMAGYTEDNKLVNFKAVSVKEGDIVPVKITEARSFSLNGEAEEGDVH